MNAEEMLRTTNTFFKSVNWSPEFQGIYWYDHRKIIKTLKKFTEFQIFLKNS